MLFWRRRKVVSFLVSGRGLLFSSVAEKIINHDIPARIGCVITDNASAQVLLRARSMKVPAYHVDPDAYSGQHGYEMAMLRLLDDRRTDLIVAAGYLRLLSARFVGRYCNRIINIHPSLLPSFPGLHSQRQALAHGVKITGCTAHFIDEGIDTGPVIMQSPVMVIENDTEESLSRRILQEECRVIAESVRLFCEERLTVTGKKVIRRT